MVTKIDKVIAQKIVADAKIALADVAKKYGVEFKYEGGSFSDAEFKPRLVFFVSAMKEEQERVLFESHAFFLKADKYWYGKEIVFRGKKYRITNIDTRRKRPIRAINTTERCYVDMTVEGIAKALSGTLVETVAA